MRRAPAAAAAGVVVAGLAIGVIGVSISGDESARPSPIEPTTSVAQLQDEQRTKALAELAARLEREAAEAAARQQSGD